MKLYLDSCVLIFAHEAQQPLRNWVLSRIATFLRTPESTLLTSRLSMLECRVRPLRESNVDLLRDYERLVTEPGFEVAEISALVIERATQLRVQYGLKTADAIHLATAIENSASLLLTGDEQFRRCKDIEIEIVPRL